MPSLTLHLDRFQPSGKIGPLPACNRAIYCVEGDAIVRSRESTDELGSDSAWGGQNGVTVESDTGATVFRWELGDTGAPPIAHGSGFSSHEALSHDVILPASEYFLRCDRVEFPPGGIAYLHTHRGPGIRGLLTGELTVSVNGSSKTIQPYEPWFENGSDPVYAQASPTDVTSFARVMLLPMETLGKPSIRYVDEGDKDKPKPQRYTVFFDKPIVFPRSA